MTLEEMVKKFTSSVLDDLRSELRQQLHSQVDQMVDEMLGVGREVKTLAAGLIAERKLRKAKDPNPSIAGQVPKKVDREPSTGRLAPTKSGRLARRTDEAIDAILDRLVPLVQASPSGLRSEHVRKALGLEAREMPRILKRALATKKLRCKGEKRATTYFVPSKATAGSAGGKARAKKAKK